MTTTLDKQLSLVERKQLQWAREKEELAALSGPWENADSAHKTKHLQKFAAHSYLRSNGSRRSSLPPIAKPPNYDKDMGGETSGYGSDNPNHTPEYHQQSWNHHANGYESSSSARDDRAKWGDRVGKQMWHDIGDYSNVVNAPGWVRRGLHGETELIVSNTSPSESPEQEYGVHDRPLTCSTTTSNNRNYIRGQNVRLDPSDVAERERRRLLAMAHQDAIRQQVEDRERRRREDKERRIQEEREEELRIEREQEIERQRKEEELKMLQEKRERELKRKEAIQEALELAEKAAREAKLQQKRSKQCVDVNLTENVKDNDRIKTSLSAEDYEKECNVVVNDNINNANTESNCDSNYEIQERLNNPVSDKINNQLERKESNINRNILAMSGHPLQSPTSSQPESIASVTQPPSFEMYTTMPFMPSVPFTVLMPTFPMPPVAIPTSVNAETSPVFRTENRVLTPTQYRNNKHYSDSSTQTEHQLLKADIVDKTNRDKLSGTEMAVYDGRRKERTRAVDRVRDVQEGRPKWGVNRPPTRYLKQSEKDPFYQRKKSRIRERAIIKLYDEKNNNFSPHSSDDSPTASPRMYRKRGYMDKRKTRSLWQRNVQLYQTEIMPLESDKEQIYYKKNECIRCCCDCRSDSHKYVELVKMAGSLNIASPKGIESADTSMQNCSSSNVDGETLERLDEIQSDLFNHRWERSSQTPIPVSNSIVIQEQINS